MGRPLNQDLCMKARSFAANSKGRLILAAAIAVMAFSGCSGCSHSNPLIGKWKLAPNASPACAVLDGIEFGDSTVTMELLGNKQTVNISYGRDGDKWSVGSPSGTMVFVKDADGIKSVSPFECQLLPAG
jgi:hypothetical protein